MPRSTAARLASTGGFLGRAMLFLVLAVVAGLLLAGLAIPVTGGLGWLTRSGITSFEALPSSLDIPALPQRSRILDDKGHVIATFYFENRIDVPLADIAPVMRQAIVDIEDSRFYEHGGMDLRGTLRAFVSNSTGQAVQGGSTLTQQYVKNVLVEAAAAQGNAQAAQEARAVDYGRKIRELRYAIALEEKYTKDEILNRYLNIAYFGSGTYGVEAAARHYFSVSAKDLTLPEAALLAGLVQSPVSYDPTRDPKLALERRNTVLARMAELGHLTAAQAAAAEASPLGLKVSPTESGCANSFYPFFCDYVQETILNDPQFGSTPDARAQLLRRGGLTIRTTLDPTVQKAAQDAVDAFVKPTDKVASAIAMVQPGTGKVLAIAQSRPYGQGKDQTTVNYAVNEKYGASRGFQAGSTFKPFVAAAAIEQGYPLNYPIKAPYQVKIGDVKACNGQVLTDPWSPTNELRSENGTFTMATGIAQSVNTYFAQLEQRVGVCQPWHIATDLGVTNADGSPLPMVKSFTLGVATVSPLSMAEAYATFAARGLHCDPMAIKSVVDRHNVLIAKPSPKCEQAIPQKVADGVNYLLQGVMKPGGTGSFLNFGRPAAGKTGTTDNLVSVWYDGYTPDLAAAVWAGNPDTATYSLRNVTIGGRYYSQVCGGCLPGPIWQKAMSAALKNVPASTFTAPDPTVVNGVGVKVPDVTGMTPADAARALQAVGLLPQVDPTTVNSDQPAGTVATSTPAAGAKAASGEVVALQLSNGTPPTPTPSPSPTDTSGGTGTISPSPSPTPTVTTLPSPSPTCKKKNCPTPPPTG